MDWGAKGAPGAPQGAHPRYKLTFWEPFGGHFLNIFQKNACFCCAVSSVVSQSCFWMVSGAFLGGWNLKNIAKPLECCSKSRVLGFALFLKNSFQKTSFGSILETIFVRSTHSRDQGRQTATTVNIKATCIAHHLQPQRRQ